MRSERRTWSSSPAGCNRALICPGLFWITGRKKGHPEAAFPLGIFYTGTHQHWVSSPQLRAHGFTGPVWSGRLRPRSNDGSVPQRAAAQPSEPLPSKGGQPDRPMEGAAPRQPHPTLPAFTGQAWALTPKPRTRARGPHSELEELDTGKGSWGSEGGQPSPTRWGRGVWWGVAGADAQQLPPETREKGTSSRSG